MEARELFISAAAPPPTIQTTYKQWFLFSFVFRAPLYILKTVLAPPVALESQQRGVAYSQCLPETGAGGVGFCLSLSSAFPPSGTPGGREASLRRRESLERFSVGSSHHSCPSTHEQLTETSGSGTQAGQPGLLEGLRAEPNQRCSGHQARVPAMTLSLNGTTKDPFGTWPLKVAEHLDCE